MRVVQPVGTRGSLKWLQHAVNDRPDLLAVPALGEIEWLSPLAEDDYAEYRDRAFLERLRLGKLAERLSAFWPQRGPQWDALGRAGEQVVLVEAKAHLDEFLTPATMAGERSRKRIDAALVSVRAALAAHDATDWTRVFYQFANRLAHLHFLTVNGVDAHLVLVGFVNDREMKGPSCAAEWQVAYTLAEYALGLPKAHALSPRIHHVNPDAASFAQAI